MKFFLLVFVFLNMKGFSAVDYKSEFAIATVAKSGTHLLKKALSLMIVYGEYSNDQKPLTEEDLVLAHFPNWGRVFPEDYVGRNKIIVNVRDLRDVCVSMVFHILDCNKKEMFLNKFDWFETLSFDEQLKFVLTSDVSVLPSFSQALSGALSCIRNFKPLVVRFENLIGEKGGGPLEAQEMEIKKIADFLEISLSSNSMEKIKESLWGNSRTFRKGKIGAWKESFNEENKAIFKERYNRYLIELGYEIDDQW